VGGDEEDGEARRKSEIRNPKSETNSKGWQVGEKESGNVDDPSGFRISVHWNLFRISCFGFRASDFEFSPSQGFLQFIQPLVVSGELPALLAVGGFDAALGA
jgi:hypothetical protein